MRLAWLYVVGFVLLWPIGFEVGMVAGKPIELVLSDALPLLVPLTYFFSRSNPSKTQLKQVKGPLQANYMVPVLALLFIVYATALAGVGLGTSGETVRILSAFKLVKPIGFVFVGILIGMWTDPFEFLAVISQVFGALVGVTMLFTMSNPDFPLGAWGKYIYEWEIVGYPNSAMSFYAAMIPLLLAMVDISKFSLSRPIGWGLSACSALIILGSMSRSSAVAMACGVVFYLAATGRFHLLMMCLIGVTISSIVGLGVFSMLKETEMMTVLSDRVNTRLNRSTEDEDPSSGRFEIWSLAIELATERPVFGYMFESFSKYAVVDTPHQQYLEILHKCGGLGLILYLAVLVSCFKLSRQLLRFTPVKSSPWHFTHAMSAMLFAIMIGNLTQPNLTYSLTGNLLFLLFGCLSTSRAVVSASQPIAALKVNVVHFDPFRFQRAA